MMALYTKKDFDFTDKNIQKKVQENLKRMRQAREKELNEKLKDKRG